MFRSKVISITMKKGGVGKTTIAINLSELLALVGYKVLIIDGDEQHNATSALNVEDLDCGLQLLFSGHVKPLDFVNRGICSTGVKNLDIVPCSDDIYKIKLPKTNVLVEFLKVIDYDFVIIDCAPGLSPLQNQYLLQCSDLFVFPVNMTQFSINGLNEMVNILTERYRKPIENIVIVPNNVKMTKHGKVKTKKHCAFLTALHDGYKNNVSNTIIAHDEYLDSVITKSKSIFLNYFKSSLAAECFLALAAEVFGLDYYNLYEQILKSRAIYRSDESRLRLNRKRNRG